MTVMGADQPLVLSSYSLGVEVSFEQRVAMAAQAGFAGIGLRAENYWEARDAGLADAAMGRILDRHGIGVHEVEFITEWGRDQDRTEEQRHKEETVFHLARTFGVGHVNVGLPREVPQDGLTDAFVALCGRAGELTVALEFLPFGSVLDLRAGWRIVGDADQSNGGLLIDTWHWARSGTAPEDLEPVPAEKIVSVQINDVRQQPMESLRFENMHFRMLPGQGYGNVTEIINALRAKGIAPRVVAAEVMSDDLLARGLPAAAQDIMAACRQVLAP